MTLSIRPPHGIACSFTLPMVLQKALGVDSERDAVLARIFGELAEAPRKLAEFLHALGVPTDFGAYGVTESDAQAMVLNATQGVRGRNFIGCAIPTS